MLLHVFNLKGKEADKSTENQDLFTEDNDIDRISQELLQ